jgi:hypothetical protein
MFFDFLQKSTLTDPSVPVALVWLALIELSASANYNN